MPKEIVRLPEQAERIRVALRQRGLTDRQFTKRAAELADVGEPAVRRWRHGINAPNQHHLTAVLDVLGLTHEQWHMPPADLEASFAPAPPILDLVLRSFRAAGLFADKNENRYRSTLRKLKGRYYAIRPSFDAQRGMIVSELSFTWADDSCHFIHQEPTMTYKGAVIKMRGGDLVMIGCDIQGDNADALYVLRTEKKRDGFSGIMVGEAKAQGHCLASTHIVLVPCDAKDWPLSPADLQALEGCDDKAVSRTELPKYVDVHDIWPMFGTPQILMSSYREKQP